MGSMIEEWEHKIVVLEADARQQAGYFQSRQPGLTPAIFSPQALIPLLDALGKEGWELVSAEPVSMGMNEDIAMYDAGDRWTHKYLCFFKRRKRAE